MTTAAKSRKDVRTDFTFLGLSIPILATRHAASFRGLTEEREDGAGSRAATTAVYRRAAVQWINRADEKTDAVTMIHATPPETRSRFGKEIWRLGRTGGRERFRSDRIPK